MVGPNGATQHLERGVAVGGDAVGVDTTKASNVEAHGMGVPCDGATVGWVLMFSFCAPPANAEQRHCMYCGGNGFARVPVGFHAMYDCVERTKCGHIVEHPFQVLA